MAAFNDRASGSRSRNDSKDKSGSSSYFYTSGKESLEEEDAAKRMEVDSQEEESDPDYIVEADHGSKGELFLEQKEMMQAAPVMKAKAKAKEVKQLTPLHPKSLREIKKIK